jgi:hypothetical protein
VVIGVSSASSANSVTPEITIFVTRVNLHHATSQLIAHSKKKIYHTSQLSSLSTPNFPHIPGLDRQMFRVPFICSIKDGEHDFPILLFFGSDDHMAIADQKTTFRCLVNVATVTGSENCNWHSDAWICWLRVLNTGHNEACFI